MTSYLGINGYVRGTVAQGYRFFTGCAPNAMVTIFTGFTQAECELLRIRYVDLLTTDGTSPYPAPLLCTSSECNSPAAVATGACSSATAPRGARAAWGAVALAAGVLAAAAA